MREKPQRHRLLMQLVRDEPVANQQQLVSLLRERGISATQASISRDVRELGLVKVDGRYVPASRVTGRGRIRVVTGPVSELITKAEAVGANLVVVRTAQGAANAVAVEFERRPVDGIVGTIAGDDTIFVAVRSRSAQGQLVAMLQAMVQKR